MTNIKYLRQSTNTIDDEAYQEESEKEVSNIYLLIIKVKVIIKVKIKYIIVTDSRAKKCF